MDHDEPSPGGASRDLAAGLHERRLRATPQRIAILAAFNGGSVEHLSAEEIYARASTRVPGVGRGTVYATLADLAEIGLIASVGDQEPVRYETNTAQHDHFRCRLCLRLFDVSVPTPSTAGLARQGYRAEHVQIIIDGVCKECEDYAAGLRDGVHAIQHEPQISSDLLSTLSCIRHETEIGTLVVAASADGIVRVVCEAQADHAAFVERAKTRKGARAGRDRAQQAMQAIEALLAGARTQPASVFDWALTGETNRAALESTRTISWGQRQSYHLLTDTGLTAYACGLAMGSNPMPFIFPCHRVTRGQETPRDYVAGAAVREHLERLEHPPS